MQAQLEDFKGSETAADLSRLSISSVKNLRRHRRGFKAKLEAEIEKVCTFIKDGTPDARRCRQRTGASNDP